jgi:hypothetical protein
VLGSAGRLVAYSTFVTFSISMFWIGLFWWMLAEYRRNIVQCVITTALVEPRARVTYSQSYLMSCMWFGLDCDETEEVLSRMPLLDLRISSNAAAFWRLRDYCTLDRSNERMAISVLLEIVLIWLVTKFLVTVATILVYGGTTAMIGVTIFDLLVFGTMIMLALTFALKMNEIWSSHKESITTAKYEVTMTHGAIVKDVKDHRVPKKTAMHGKIKDFKMFEKDQMVDDMATFVHDELKAVHQDLELSRRLLTEYLDLCNEYDQKEYILFGVEVTPGKIMSYAGTVFFSVYTLLTYTLGTYTEFKAGRIQEAVGGGHFLADDGLNETMSQTVTTFLSNVSNHFLHL